MSAHLQMGLKEIRNRQLWKDNFISFMRNSCHEQRPEVDSHLFPPHLWKGSKCDSQEQHLTSLPFGVETDMGKAVLVGH